MDNIDEEYDRFVHHLRDSAKGAESLKTTKRRLSPETLELIRQLEHHERGSQGEKGEVLAEAAEAGLSIHNSRRNFDNIKTKMTVLRRPDEIVTSSRRTMEKRCYTEDPRQLCGRRGGRLLTGSASIVLFLSNRPPSAASTSLVASEVIVILFYSPPVLSTNMDAGSKPLKTTPRAHPKTGRKIPPGRRPSIDPFDLLDPSTTTTAADQIAGSAGALLNDSTIPDYIRAIISLLLEERKRHIAILKKLRELSDDNGLLRAANLRVRSIAPLRKLTCAIVLNARNVHIR
ncbi:unnamed protein product [Heligmosomoides polygyrus]|uniref:Uncharacterized protein n=1 Tax=Heligmosomoides polygyrus TaxID=6339 RepID=A0A3P8AGP3_HELPZ|nr:unnamed protein product [Heligmosomoides polygyrus]